MKLEDIDVLTSWRRTYQELCAELKSVKAHRPGVVQFGQSYVKHNEVLTVVQLATLPIIEKKLDEAKTKLMMLGITEFPE